MYSVIRNANNEVSGSNHAEPDDSTEHVFNNEEIGNIFISIFTSLPACLKIYPTHPTSGANPVYFANAIVLFFLGMNLMNNQPHTNTADIFIE